MLLPLPACVPAEGTGAPRVLDIALWAGAPASDAELPRVDTVGGRNQNRRIRGPIRWRNPTTGERLRVYERTKTGRRRQKRQLLTPTHGGQGLGRVLDERSDAPIRYFEDDIIFPLGPWRDRERRTFSAVEQTVVGPAPRRIEIFVRDLDFIFDDTPGALRYDWTARDAADRVIYRERYVYAPGRGLVAFEDLT